MGEDNRERILEAALSALSRQGYANTSVKDIADEAGVATGLVHYYFKSKQELLVAALLRCCEQISLKLETAAEAEAAFQLLKDSLAEKNDFHRFFVEMIGVGLHDKQLGEGVLEFIRTDRGFVEQVTDRVVGEGLDPAGRKAMAAAIWAAILGISVQRLVDPDFDAPAAVDALALLSLTTVERVAVPATANR